MKLNKKVVLAFSFMIIILLFSIIAMKEETKNMTVRTNSNVTLSNKKVGWGIKRNDNHKQPDLGASNKKLIDENNDIAMGNNEDKFVYLTFDEGYEAGYSTEILNTLKQNNVKAAFFITGHYLNSQPELVDRMIKEGHIVGNHTVNHYSMPDLSDEQIKDEIQKLHLAVYEKFNY